jgi:hypothetical protein
MDGIVETGVAGCIGWVLEMRSSGRGRAHRDYVVSE